MAAIMPDDTDFQTVHVPGLGDLRFPSDLQDDEIEAAIKKHPDYQKAVEFNNSTVGSIYNTLDNMSRALTRPINKAIDAVPGARPVVDFTTGMQTSVTKGIPLLGRLVPQTEKQTEFEKNHPIADKAGRAIGTVTSAVPIMAASEMWGPATLGKQMLSQAGIWGSLGAADKAVEKGKDTNAADLGKAFAIDAGLGALGAFGSRLISPTKAKIPDYVPLPPLDPFTKTWQKYRPSARNVPTPSEAPLKPWEKATNAYKQLQGLLDRTRAQANHDLAGIAVPTRARSYEEWWHGRQLGRQAQALSEHVNQPLSPRAARNIELVSDILGTGTGYATHGILGGVLGHYAGKNLLSPGIKAIAESDLPRKYLYNQLGHSPYTKAIIQGLLHAPYSDQEEIDQRE